MKKIMLIALMLLVLVIGCTEIESGDITQKDQKDSKNEEKTGFDGITEQQCKETNGYWNECGSPCAGTDAEMCIQVCQAQCECGGIAGFGCPERYKCRLTGKIADEMGVCIRG